MKEKTRGNKQKKNNIKKSRTMEEGRNKSKKKVGNNSENKK